MGLYLENWDSYPAFKSIITRFGVHNTSGVQFTHSLLDFIRIYVFGERIAPITISGFSFSNVCDIISERISFPDGSTAFVPSYHGLEYVLDFYDAFRVSETGDPLMLVFGLSAVFYGFLIESSVQVADAERNLIEFTLSFKGIRQDTAMDLLSEAEDTTTDLAEIASVIGSALSTPSGDGSLLTGVAGGAVSSVISTAPPLLQ
jgi:hypothetical protein